MPRGLVPPGYRYLGPFNDLNRGEPTNANDAAAQQHDIEYGEQGILSYVTYNQADEDFLNRLEPNDLATEIASNIFHAKKRLAPRKPGNYKDTPTMRGWQGKSQKERNREEMAKSKAQAQAAVESGWAEWGPDGKIRYFDDNEITAKAGNKRLRTGEAAPEQPERPQNIPLPPPDDDDLMDDAARAGNEDPFDNTPDIQDLLPDMEVDQGGEPEAARVGAASSGGNNPQSKETPISIYPTLTYGLQETHTTILPWSGWVSFGWLDKSTPLKLALRMNAIWDIFPNTITDLASGGSIAAKAWHNRPIGTSSANTANAVFPTTMAAGTNTTERPQWREYWAKLYDYYTVLGCEYEIILYNPIQVKDVRPVLLPGKTLVGTNAATYPAVAALIDNGWFNTDIIVGTQFDTYSDTATSTGNVMPQTYYEEVRAFKNIRWTPVPGGRKAVIKGTYKPGQASRNIVNDGDVKTWTATSATLPNLKEILTLNFWEDPFYNARARDAFDTAASYEQSDVGTVIKGAVNMEVNLKYIVQFKDLKQQARYPNSITTDQDITQILNESIGASGSAPIS